MDKAGDYGRPIYYDHELNCMINFK